MRITEQLIILVIYGVKETYINNTKIETLYLCFYNLANDELLVA